MNTTVSRLKELGEVTLPEFFGDQLSMFPVDFSTPNWSLPENMKRWEITVRELISKFPRPISGISFVTVDQKEIQQGLSHRRPGPHTDGNYTVGQSEWAGSDGKPAQWLINGTSKRLTHEQHRTHYHSSKGGMIIASNFSSCRAWQGEFQGLPTQGGDCSHMSDQLKQTHAKLLEPNKVYWMNSMGIHESLPVPHTVKRTLVRITLPETIPGI